MFVKKEHAQQVKKFLRKAGYQYKTKKIDYIELSNGNLSVYTEGSETKVFNLKKDK